MSKINNKEIFDRIVSFLKNYNVLKIAVFGSYAIDKNTEDSDVDVIVDFNERISFLRFINIQQKLTDYLGIEVDLLTEESISPYLLPTIKKEMKILYET